MTQDDGELDDEYFTPLAFREESAPEATPESAPEDDKRAPNHRIAFLRRILADPNQSYSTRQDAGRLIQMSDIAPARFDQEYEDFLAYEASKQ